MYNIPKSHELNKSMCRELKSHIPACFTHKTYCIPPSRNLHISTSHKLHTSMSHELNTSTRQ